MVHFSDALFLYLQEVDCENFTITETPLGIKIVEWFYTEDRIFIGIFTYENVLIIYHFE